MNNVVRTGGIVLIALGVLAILLTLVTGDSFRGLTLESGATLLAGGFIALGLSTLAAAVETLRAYIAVEEQETETFEPSAGAMPRSFAENLRPAETTFNPGGNVQGARLEDHELAAPHLDMPRPAEERFSLLRETPPPPELEPEPEPLAEPERESEVEDVHDYERVSEQAVSEEELYVVEERTIAGKPARILSDGTVEAETDDGWMRFENVEHLEEYMEAVRAQHG
jgi:hypothetical protein